MYASATLAGCALCQPRQPRPGSRRPPCVLPAAPPPAPLSGPSAPDAHPLGWVRVAAKLILISSNCPPLRKSEIEYYAMLAKTSVHHYSGSMHHAPRPRLNRLHARSLASCACGGGRKAAARWEGNCVTRARQALDARAAVATAAAQQACCCCETEARQQAGVGVVLHTHELRGGEMCCGGEDAWWRTHGPLPLLLSLSSLSSLVANA